MPHASLIGLGVREGFSALISSSFEDVYFGASGGLVTRPRPDITTASTGKLAVAALAPARSSTSFTRPNPAAGGVGVPLIGRHRQRPENLLNELHPELGTGNKRNHPPVICWFRTRSSPVRRQGCSPRRNLEPTTLESIRPILRAFLKRLGGAVIAHNPPGLAGPSEPLYAL